VRGGVPSDFSQNVTATREFPAMEMWVSLIGSGFMPKRWNAFEDVVLDVRSIIGRLKGCVSRKKSCPVPEMQP